jgi:hypothetical protein
MRIASGLPTLDIENDVCVIKQALEPLLNENCQRIAYLGY